MKKQLFGKLPDGQSVYKYTVATERMELSVIEYGAAIQTLKFDGNDVVLGYDTAEEYYENDGNLGAVVGRCANRISGAKFRLNEKEYALYKNDGENSLHGGKKGFDRVMWKVFEREDGCGLTCKYISCDGEENYPGNLTVTVDYVINDTALEINYHAVTDADTVVNLTNHSFFNLDGEGTINEHLMKVNADKFVVLKSDHTPTGEIRSVKNSALDFTTEKPLIDCIKSTEEQVKFANGIDNYFVIDGQGLRRAVWLYSKKSNIEMTCLTSTEGVLIYSGNFLSERHGKYNKKIDFRYGVCFETHGYPNAVNIKDFPSQVLRAGEEYERKTVFAFSKRFG